MTILTRGAMGLLLLFGVAEAQQPVPLGEEFQVNTYSTSDQINPSVATDGTGHAVVVWGSYGSSGTDSSYTSIQGQLYDAAGDPLSGEFQVNTYTTGAQFYPSVARSVDGEFVVVWGSYGSAGPDTSASSIQVRRFDAAGTAIGAEFQVNTYSTGVQYDPRVALAADGSFVVVWVSTGSSGTDLSDTSIQGQLFDPLSNPVGDEFQVNTYTTLRQERPSVGYDALGAFVVAWSSWRSDGPDPSNSIQGQRFDAAGSPIGDEFQINAYTTGVQINPSVAVSANDGFDVVWNSEGSDGSDTDSHSIQGQRFSTTGQPIGGQFQVNSYTTEDQGSPSVASDPSGEWVVIWVSDGSSGTDSSYSSIQGQVFDAEGPPIGGEFQVNTYTYRSQVNPEVAAHGSGFIVVWQSLDGGGPDTGWRIQGQRFADSTIFADTFESGDTSAWSSSVP